MFVITLFLSFSNKFILLFLLLLYTFLSGSMKPCKAIDKEMVLFL